MRIGWLFPFIALLGAAVAACNPSPPEDKEPTVITFAIPVTATSFTQANFGALVETFNQANPDVEVRLRAIGVGEIKEVGDLYSDIMLNEDWGIDVFFARGGTITNRLVESGRILNLQPLLDMDASWELDDFYPAVLARFQHADQLWGVPTEFVPLAIFFNKDLFDEAGVAYPQPGWTRDDFLATAVKLKAALPEKDFPFAGGIDAAVPFIYTHGGSLLDEDGNCALDDSLTTKALRWYFDLALVHEVMPTLPQIETYVGELPSNVSDAIMFGVIGDEELGEDELRAIEADGWLNLAAQWGDVGMWIAPLWEQGGWRGAPWKFRWGVAPLPRDAVEVALLDAYGCFVTAHTQHPQEALRWIAYLARNRVNISGLPARRSLAQSAAFRGALPQEIDTSALDGLLVQMERGRPLPSITIRLIAIEKTAARCLGRVMVDVLERGEDVKTALLKAHQGFSGP